MGKLRVEYLSPTQLRPYANNAKLHPAEQIEQIKRSIAEFGFNDPIAVWKDSEVIEGHGRLIAALEMELEEIPVIRLDDLTDEQRRAYMLAHNKITMNSGFDLDLLQLELEGLDDFTMEDYGFQLFDELEEIEKEADQLYSKNVKIPQYEIKGDEPDVSDLADDGKTQDLIAEILDADIDERTKEFLIKAAYRHTVFDYGKIAEFYAHQEADVQRLMEKSALVIIDVDDALANGYIKLSKAVANLIEAETEDA